MDFPRGYPPLPARRFPIRPASGVSPKGAGTKRCVQRMFRLPAPLPDCHLVRTAILCLPRARDPVPGQPRCFPQQSNRLLASFAVSISRANAPLAWPWQRRVIPLSAFTTQGRLHCTQHREHCCSRLSPKRASRARARSARFMHCNTGSSLIRTGSVHGRAGELSRTRSGLHENRVGFPMPLEIALRTQAQQKLRFPPAPTPNWAFKADTRGFNDVPFKGFLGPSW